MSLNICKASDIVVSSIKRPVATEKQVAGGYQYNIYIAFQLDSTTLEPRNRLYEIEFVTQTKCTKEQIQLVFWGNSYYVYVYDHSYTGTMYTYNLENGNVYSQAQMQSVSYGTYHYDKIKFPEINRDTVINVLPIVGEVGTTQIQGTEFVQWAINVPPVKLYTSYTSKPISDEHNRYLILGTEDKAYLYWFTLKQYALEYVDSTETIDLTNKGAPFNITITVDNTITMGWTYATLDYASAPLAQLRYSVVITRYDLQTGTYQNSWSYSGTLTSQDETFPLNGAFDDNYTSIESIGLYCEVKKPINRASIQWSYNPLFEQWKTEQTQYLQRIIALLEQTGEEVTIRQEQQAIDSASEAINDLQIKDENGSVMKADEEASKAFAQAQQGIQDLANPVKQLGESITGVYADNILYVPVIVALALGLLVTILGKNKSD